MPKPPTNQRCGKSVESHEYRVDGPFPLYGTCVKHQTWDTLKVDKTGSCNLQALPPVSNQGGVVKAVMFAMVSSKKEVESAVMTRKI